MDVQKEKGALQELQAPYLVQVERIKIKQNKVAAKVVRKVTNVLGLEEHHKQLAQVARTKIKLVKHHVTIVKKVTTALRRRCNPKQSARQVQNVPVQKELLTVNVTKAPGKKILDKLHVTIVWHGV